MHAQLSVEKIKRSLKKKNLSTIFFLPLLKSGGEFLGNDKTEKPQASILIKELNQLNYGVTRFKLIMHLPTTTNSRGPT